MYIVMGYPQSFIPEFIRECSTKEQALLVARSVNLAFIRDGEPQNQFCEISIMRCAANEPRMEVYRRRYGYEVGYALTGDTEDLQTHNIGW